MGKIKNNIAIMQSFRGMYMRNTADINELDDIAGG